MSEPQQPRGDRRTAAGSAEDRPASASSLAPGSTGVDEAADEAPESEGGGEEMTTTPLREKMVEALKSVYDPEIPVDIWELGLIYETDVDAVGHAKIKMTLTSPACPVAGSLPGEVERRICEIPGITQCDVDLVWDPPWGPAMMSEVARLKLNL